MYKNNYDNYFYYYCRGGTFRTLFDRLGEIRSLVPSKINMMALTATASKTLRLEISLILGMRDYVLVERSPDKPNVYLVCQEFQSLQETFGPVVERLRIERVAMGRIIIFCKKRHLCSQIYSYFQYCLGDYFTEPPNEKDTIPEHRLVDMFTSGTHPDVKEKIVKSFKSSTAPLRIVVATIAFSMGIDCHNVRQTIHIGPPEDVESYIQQIGRCGRDNKPACALMLYGKGLMDNTSSDLIKYCNTNRCRRNFLFFDFECYKPDSVFGCKCCDVCTKSCVCNNCSNNLCTFIF